MISKKYRLTDREVKKVLQKGKPFFSSGIVSNTFKNRLGHNRFAIVISGKSVKNNVQRNFFRRMFYDITVPLLEQGSFDIVFVVKTKTKLDRDEKKVRDTFKNDILFCVKKTLSL